MGHRDKIEQGLGGLRTVLARVKQGLPMERKNFEFLEKSGRWTRNLNMNNLKDILGHMGHGALFKCPKDASGNHVFGPHGFPYVFVGVVSTMFLWVESTLTHSTGQIPELKLLPLCRRQNRRRVACREPRPASKVPRGKEQSAVLPISASVGLELGKGRAHGFVDG